MDSLDPLITSTLEDKPPPNPLLSAVKRAVWIIITLLIILSLILSMLVPLLQRREPRRNPDNEIQAYWTVISDP